MDGEIEESILKQRKEKEKKQIKERGKKRRIKKKKYKKKREVPRMASPRPHQDNIDRGLTHHWGHYTVH